ncbi:MAG TPA: acetyl-CoA carboxylase biotin carboxyl carrier protein [Pyrinomonadaceae bacterium]|nr:acetyl-CoA carboxylase biotin carboxyl carrier protein [Pyrinomonadaceae bacterium]
MSEPENLHEPSNPQVEVESQDPGQPNRRRRQRSRQIDPSVNMDELRELIDLIQENDFAEFEIAREGFRLHVRRGAAAVAEGGGDAGSPATSERAEPPAAGAQAQTGSGAAHPAGQPRIAASEDQDLHLIASPIVGTFYRSPSPNADPFVKIGSNVEAETIVCIIEAMKLMNEIQAETAGEVVKIYVENGQPVEYGQPLFGIKR